MATWILILNIIATNNVKTKNDNVQKFNYNLNEFPFRRLLEKLYKVKKIEKIHNIKPHLMPKEKIVFPKS